MQQRPREVPGLSLHVEASNAINVKLAALGQPQIHPSQRKRVKETLQRLVAEGHADLAPLLARADAAPPEEFGD